MPLSYGDGALFLAVDELPKAFIPSHILSSQCSTHPGSLMVQYTSHLDFSIFVCEELTDDSSPALAESSFVPNIDYS